MGVDITPLLEPKEISLKELSSRKVGVDAFNTIYQFLSIIRQADGTPLMDSNGNITSHLSGLYHRTINLLSNSIKPCFVFDGKSPDFKKKTIELRRERKESAVEEWKKALEEGDMEKAKSKASQTSILTKDMIEESKKLLSAMGIPIVEAPSEGEAQASFMCRTGKIYGVISQDYDSLLFGAPVLLRNITVTGKRKVPGKPIYQTQSPEIIFLDKVLKANNLTQKELILTGIFCGTDFNPKGIKGIGPKKALDIIKKEGTSFSIFKNHGWDFDIEPEEIYDFFVNPPTTEKFTLEWKELDIEKVKQILCKEHDFSEERVDSSYEKIKELSKKGSQSSLSGFL